MKLHHLMLGAALLAVFPNAASAEEKADNHRLHAAWDALTKEEGQFLSSRQFSGLTGLAYQASLVKICDGQKLDQEAFAKKIGAIIEDADKKLDDEEMEQRKDAVLVAFGARFGIFLAEGSANKTSFCSAVNEIKADKNVSVLAR